MNKNDVIELEGREASTDPLSEQLLPGAQKLIYQAIEAEPAACLEQHAERQTPPGNAGVVRNGYLPGRELASR